MTSKCCDTNSDLNQQLLPDDFIHNLNVDKFSGDGVVTPIYIMQMDCPTEEALIRKRLSGMAQVQSIHFDLIRRVLTVQHSIDGLIAIIDAIRSLGFNPKILNSPKSKPKEEKVKPWWPLALAFCLAIVAEISHWLNMPLLIQFSLSAIAIAISGVATYKKGFISLKNKNLNINALMSIAVTGALIIGQWPEAAMVMVLFAIAEAIEAKSLDKARTSVAALMQQAPNKAYVKRSENDWYLIDVDDVAVGDIVRASPGERIALDGEVVFGSSDVNQAPITGESIPVSKTLNSKVYAGSINGMAELHYKVTTKSDNTMLARIVHMVHDAQSSKAPIQRFVDKFSAIYTPVVCLIAIFVAIVPPVFMGANWYEWIYKALVLLVIACPCALVISTPVAVVISLGVAARNGVLVKGGVYLEQARLIKNMAFDKTGTITTGTPSLNEILILNKDIDKQNILDIAYCMASRSDHPISLAIKNGITNNYDGIDSKKLTVNSFTAVAGGGTWGVVNSEKLFMGNLQWVTAQLSKNLITAYIDHEQELAIASMQAKGQSITVFASESKGLLALFSVSDSLRKNADSVILQIHNLGINTIMLSGDSPAAARYVAQECGIKNVYGGLLPEQKLQHIKNMAQNGVTAMIGDGINDAPALAQADIGFAMGAMGTDSAIETADVALMDSNLQKIPFFIKLSSYTHKILIQNISLALGIKLVFLAFTVVGIATMWMAVFADVGASLIVLANSMRVMQHNK